MKCLVKLSRPVFFTIITFTFGCTDSNVSRPEESARNLSASEIDGGVLPVFEALPPILKQRFQTSKGQAELRQASRDKRNLVKEARRRGLDKSPEIQLKVKQLEERLLIQALMRDEEKDLKPTEEELRAYYDSHRRDFRVQPTVRLARIYFEVLEERRRPIAKRKAEAALQQLKRDPSKFAELARQADGPERQRDGVLGIFQRGARQHAKLVRAAFALEDLKETTGVIEESDGFSIGKVIEKRPARVKSFEEVRGEVENKVRMRKTRGVFDALVKRGREASGRNP